MLSDSILSPFYDSSQQNAQSCVGPHNFFKSKGDPQFSDGGRPNCQGCQGDSQLRKGTPSFRMGDIPKTREGGWLGVPLLARGTSILSSLANRLPTGFPVTRWRLGLFRSFGTTESQVARAGWRAPRLASGASRECYPAKIPKDSAGRLTTVPQAHSSSLHLPGRKRRWSRARLLARPATR